MSDTALARLQALLRVPTISHEDEADNDGEQFERFRSLLREFYPLAHRRLDREVIAEHSLLLRWKGLSDAEPTILAAHYDVAAPTQAHWTYPPFEARVADRDGEQLIWGRGVIDDKGALAAMLEAVETHLEAGLRPRQDIYLCLCHDEEAAGTGAHAIVSLLESRGVRPALVLSEGGAITHTAFPGTNRGVATVGVAEKGVATIRVTAEQTGADAAAPPRRTAPMRLARAMVRLGGDRSQSSVGSIAADTLRTLGDHSSGPIGFLLRNIRYTAPIMLPLLVRYGPEAAALVQTTHAVTSLSAGHRADALPQRASATVTIRIPLGSTVDAAVRKTTGALGDRGLKVETLSAHEPSPASLRSGIGWESVRTTIEKVYPGTVVVPHVTNSATEGRHFASLSRSVYRFTPFDLTSEQFAARHAGNERMSTTGYLRGIEFYSTLIASL